MIVFVSHRSIREDCSLIQFHTFAMFGACDGELVGMEVFPDGMIDDFLGLEAENVNNRVGGVKDICVRAQICGGQSAASRVR